MLLPHICTSMLAFLEVQWEHFEFSKSRQPNFQRFSRKTLGGEYWRRQGEWEWKRLWKWRDSEFKPILHKLVQYKSWVWHYGKLSFQRRNKKNEACWHCNICISKRIPQSLSTKSSTWIAKLLREEHHIAKKPFQASICPTMIDSEEEATILDLMRNLKRPVNKTNFQTNLTTWIDVSRQAFLAMEEPSFHEMISGLSLDAVERRNATKVKQ